MNPTAVNAQFDTKTLTRGVPIYFAIGFKEKGNINYGYALVYTCEPERLQFVKMIPSGQMQFIGISIQDIIKENAKVELLERNRWDAGDL